MNTDEVISNFLNISKRDYFTKENYRNLALFYSTLNGADVFDLRDFDPKFSYDKKTIEEFFRVDRGKQYKFSNQEYNIAKNENTPIILIGKTFSAFDILLGSLKIAGEKQIFTHILKCSDKENKFYNAFNVCPQIAEISCYSRVADFQGIDSNLQTILQHKKSLKNVKIFLFGQYNNAESNRILIEIFKSLSNFVDTIEYELIVDSYDIYWKLSQRNVPNAHCYGWFPEFAIENLINISFGSDDFYFGTSDLEEKPNIFIECTNYDVFFYNSDNLYIQLNIENFLKYKSIRCIGPDMLFSYYLYCLIHCPEALNGYFVDENTNMYTLYKDELIVKENYSNRDYIGLIEEICYRNENIHYFSDFVNVPQRIADYINFCQNNDENIFNLNKPLIEGDFSDPQPLLICGFAKEIMPFLLAAISTHKKGAISTIIFSEDQEDDSLIGSLEKYGYLNFVMRNVVDDEYIDLLLNPYFSDNENADVIFFGDRTQGFLKDLLKYILLAIGNKNTHVYINNIIDYLDVLKKKNANQIEMNYSSKLANGIFDYIVENHSIKTLTLVGENELTNAFMKLCLERNQFQCKYYCLSNEENLNGNKDNRIIILDSNKPYIDDDDNYLILSNDNEISFGYYTCLDIGNKNSSFFIFTKYEGDKMLYEKYHNKENIKNAIILTEEVIMKYCFKKPKK